MAINVEHTYEQNYICSGETCILLLVAGVTLKANCFGHVYKNKEIPDSGKQFLLFKVNFIFNRFVILYWRRGSCKEIGV